MYKLTMRQAMLALFTLVISISASASNTDVIRFSPKGDTDMTPLVRRAINKTKGKAIHLEFAPGEYHFTGEFALNRYEAPINHDNGMKRIIFPIDKRNEVSIKSEGAHFIFHGRVAPFQFVDCKKVTVEGISIHWDIPFLFAGKVTAVNKEEGWREIKPVNPKGKWTISKGRLQWPNIEGFKYTELGSSLAFTADTKTPVDGAQDFRSHETKVEKRPGGIVRIYEKLKYYPPVGSILNSKGDKAQDRYGAAFRAVRCNNLLYKDVVVHHALGMGYLYEFCDGITLDHCGIYVEDDSPEVVSTTADATHFANCKGHILIDKCRFENMLDDGTNVHGTYVSIVKRMNKNKVRVALMHDEQLGGAFAMEGDTLWLIHQPDPNRMEQLAVVKKINVINEQYMDVTLEEDLPEEIMAGDVLENKTWNPTFTMSNCVIRDHRARNVIIKTPLKIVIENNDFSSMMSGIQLRGETFYWFESGAVTDVLIQNNRFRHAASGAKMHAILYVTPRLGKHFDKHALYDRNIRFINNVIENYQPRVIWAFNVDGLVVENNKITETYETKPTQGDVPMFDLIDCANVSIQKNVYTGKHKNILQADEASKKTLIFKKNKINRP